MGLARVLAACSAVALACGPTRGKRYILGTVRPAFDPRESFSVVLHDLGPISVSRPGADGVWVTIEERQRAMSVFVDGMATIDAGLVLTAADELVAFSWCGVCDLWECNLTEGYAAKVRGFGPYVFWLRPSGELYTFGREQYVEVLGPGAPPELTPDEAWEFEDTEPECSYSGVDGPVIAAFREQDPDGPLTALRDWPGHGDAGLRPVEPPAEAREIRPTTAGAASIWIDVVPRADGSRAAFLPGLTRARVWCAGPAVERAIAALVGPAFRVRAATPGDADAIAAAHVESIRSLGPAAYDSEVVDDWGAPRTGERYWQAMASGEAFFVAVDEHGQILGFAAHRIAAVEHRIAVYVRGSASRRGIGRALFAAAEAVARDRGADEIRVDASLVAVPFYTAIGFVTGDAATHTLRSGRAMACVTMTKPLSPVTAR